MDTVRTPREIEIRKEIADLDKKIRYGMPAHLDSERSLLHRELVKLVAARMIETYD